MKGSFKNELILWTIMLMPLAYLAMVWNQLPEIVPTHFDATGKADGFGSKMTLFWLSALLPFGTYALMTLVAKIDPKQSLHKMGSKFFTFKLFLVAFMSVISFFVIRSAQVGGMNASWIYALVCLLLVVLGNYLQSVPPNYFIGVRTPWTLENETVWKRTHRIAGRLMMAVGLVLFILSLIVNPKIFASILIGGTLLTALVPLVYSYMEFQKLKKA